MESNQEWARNRVVDLSRKITKDFEAGILPSNAVLDMLHFASSIEIDERSGRQRDVDAKLLLQGI